MTEILEIVYFSIGKMADVPKWIFGNAPMAGKELTKHPARMEASSTVISVPNLRERPGNVADCERPLWKSWMTERMRLGISLRGYNCERDGCRNASRWRSCIQSCASADPSLFNSPRRSIILYPMHKFSKDLPCRELQGDYNWRYGTQSLKVVGSKSI